jgi:hypothetical protein
MEFMNYTSKMRELLMLIELETNSSITQYELSKVSDIVSSMVNNYINLLSFTQCWKLLA